MYLQHCLVVTWLVPPAVLKVQAFPLVSFVQKKHFKYLRVQIVTFVCFVLAHVYFGGGGGVFFIMKFSCKVNTHCTGPFGIYDTYT